MSGLIPHIIKSRVAVGVIAILSLCVASTPAFSQAKSGTISLTAPSGGEEWATGTTQAIAWNAENLNGQLALELVREDSTVQQIGKATAKSGSYDWTIPGDLEEASDYRVVIASSGNSSASDTSEAFRIYAPANLYSVSGTVSDTSGAGIAQVTLSLGGDAEQTVQTDKEGIFQFEGLADGAYTLTASRSPYTFDPDTLSFTVEGADLSGLAFTGQKETGGNNGGGGTKADSAAVTLTAPSGGEEWATGTTQAIAWSAENLNGQLALELVREDSTVQQIGKATAKSGSYDWTIPGDLEEASDYRVVISSSGNSSASDTSEAFRIYAPANLYSVSGTVSDTSGAGIARVTLSLGGDAEQTVQTDKEGIFQFEGLADGAYTLFAARPPYSFTPAEMSFNVEGADLSGLAFTGQKETGGNNGGGGTKADSATVTLTAPSGGEEWVAGSSQVISWSANGAKGRWELSLWDNSEKVSSIGTPRNKDTEYQWAIPGDLTASDNYRIMIRSLVDTTLADTSEVFSVYTPEHFYTLSGTVTDTSGAGLFKVTMQLSGTADMSIESDKEGAFSFSGLPAGNYRIIPEKKPYQFTPDTLELTVEENMTGLQFTGSKEQSGNDGNGGNSGKDSLTVTLAAPAAGAEWAAGTSQAIQWEASHPKGHWQLELWDHSSHILDIGEARPSLTSYTWEIPADIIASDTYRVVIYSRADTSLADTSGNFSIYSPEELYGISGSVVNASGEGLSRVVMMLEGASDRTILTDEEGTFLFEGLPAGTYTVTPEKKPYQFAPKQMSLIISEEEINGLKFTGQKQQGNNGQANSNREVKIDLRMGWNLVGLPVNPSNKHYQTLFDNPGQAPYQFDGSYRKVDSLKLNRGYWIKSKRKIKLGITGQSVDNLQIALTKGWNLISGISTPLAVNDIEDPDGIIIGNPWRFSGAYFSADTLHPGMGYWIKARNAGVILLNGTSETEENAQNSVNNPLVEQTGSPVTGTPVRMATNSGELAMHEVSFSALGGERRFYFGRSPDPRSGRAELSLPPSAPGKAFEVRLSGSDRLVSESSDVMFEIQMPDSVTATVKPYLDDELLNGASYRYQILSEAAIIEEGLVEKGMQITLNSVTIVGLRLYEVLPLPEEIDLPQTFELAQNYPNPFNPTTTIPYQVPEQARVKLEVYNMLGRRVKVLVDGEKQAGTYRVQLDGSGLSSGIYIYRLQAGNYVETRKLILIK